MDNRNIPPDSRGTSSQQAMQYMSTSSIASASTGSLAPSPENTRPSQQTRRLQLRNAGFRGQTLPTRRISPLWSCSAKSPESLGRIANDENPPNTVEKRLAYGEDLPPNPVNILQELHNSARRRRQTSNLSIGAIFQDSTATPPADENSHPSWYSETSNSNTPIQSRNSSLPMMKLREVSFNGRTPPPLSSPLAKQTRGRNGIRVHQRSTSGEATKYIEHLESQLVAVNTKLDSLMSPTSHKARAAKLRALTTEARSLRQQVSEWEEKFDERVHEERSQLAQVEMTLIARLQSLEDEVELKDNRVRDLEWQMECFKAQVKDAEGLKDVNADLERRIDFLTKLLVQSPTKLDLCSTASSPSKADPRKRVGRPRSMMPRIPPSPGSKRLSLNIGPEMLFRGSRQSIGSACSPMQSPEATSSLPLEREQLSQNEDLKGSSTSSEMGSGHSSSFRSPPTSSSRPTSFHSNGSFGAYSWGLPLPPDTDAHVKAGHKQRRMRRFPSGAGTLKPLILPSSAGTPSLSASAPVQTTCEATPQRDFSCAFMDPTIAFLSIHEFSSPIDTPTQPERRRSTSYARREALTALEGQSSSSVDKDDVYSVQSPRSCSEEPLETVEEESSEGRPLKKDRPRSLGEELADAGLLSACSIDDGLIPCSDSSAGHESEQEFDTTGIDPSQSRFQNQEPQFHETVESETIPRMTACPVKVQTPSSKPIASTSVATRHAYGLFTRIKGLVLRTRQDPVELARRLVYNAWAIGVAKLGGMGWWLLGVLYANRWRRKKAVADVESTVEEVPAPSRDWHHFTTSNSRLRNASQPDETLHPPNNDVMNSHVGNVSARTRYLTPDQAQRARPKDALLPKAESHLKVCPDCEQPASRRTFRLWFRFSVAIVLAVGLAIKDGPGSLLEDQDATNRALYKTWQSTPPKVRCSSEGQSRSAHGKTRKPVKPYESPMNYGTING
ncbi:MAG: hypothetical protein Q9168_004269 [Polycauliona sp. 1 TL-2023]